MGLEPTKISVIICLHTAICYSICGIFCLCLFVCLFVLVISIMNLEKAMVTHSSVLVWRIPATAEAGGLPSMGSHRVGHNWRDLAATEAAA